MRINLNITPKLALIFVAFATLLLAVISVLAYTSGRSSLQAAAVSELLSNAIDKQAGLTDWIGEAQVHAGAIASSPYIQERLASFRAAQMQGNTINAQAAHDRLVAELQVWTGENRDFLGWMIMDPASGQIIASTDAREEGKYRDDQAYFINGRSGSYVQNVYFSLAVQSTLLTVSAPIHSANGSLQGVLAGNLDLGKMNAIVSRRTGLRQSDDAYLVNTSELFVTQPRFLSDPAVLRLGVHTEAVKQCLARSSGVVTATDYRSIPAMIVYRWLPERQLCLVVKMDQAEALAPANRLGWNILIISGLALLAAAGLAFWLARSITAPIHQLAKGAAEIGSGNLDYRIELKSKDELGQLAGEFNHMSGSIAAMQTQLGQRAELLEAANKELEAFSYSISHDLRAPLRAMDGFSRILLEDFGSELPAEARRYLGLVRDNAQQMGHLIEDLLAFSRLSRLPLKKQTVLPAGIVQQALAELQLNQDQHRVDVKVGDLPACEADPALLKQVWVNLLANAFKFTRKTEQACVEIGWLSPTPREGRDDMDGEKPGVGCYFVKDNGVGFDMQYVHKLFGVFQRLHRAEEYEGTGVGLAIVQRIVHRHGGRVWAEAQVDKGATFYFTLEGGIR
jgi:signal transduction histidine kinase